MLRNIGGVIAGIVAGFVTIWLVEFIGHQFYPMPANVDLTDREGMSAIIAALPAGALLFVVAAWFLGALVGGGVAARVSGERWAAWVIAGLIAVASIANVLMFPHPLWMKVAGVVAPLLGGWLGSGMARRRMHGGDAAAPTREADAEA